MSETTTAITAQENLPEADRGRVLNVWRNRDDFDFVARQAAALANSTIIPSQFQNKPNDCFVVAELAARLDLPPLFVMQNLSVVRGKPSWNGQACMAIIKSCGEFANVHPVYIGQEGTASRGCYVSAIRVSTGEVVDGVKVTLKMAQDEGWMSNSKWKTMPDLMLGYRAASFFAKVYCPEYMMGIQTKEEMVDISTAPKTKVQSLTDALRAETEE